MWWKSRPRLIFDQPASGAETAVSPPAIPSEPLGLSLYWLCFNTTCLWLEGTVQPFGYKVAPRAVGWARLCAGWQQLSAAGASGRVAGIKGQKRSDP